MADDVKVEKGSGKNTKNIRINADDFIKAYLAPFILLMIWLHLFEKSPRDQYTSVYTRVMFLVISCVIPFIFYYFFQIFAKFHRRILLLFLFATLLTAALDMICYGISKKGTICYDRFYAKEELLFKNDTITIYGKKRGFLKRFRKVGDGGDAHGEEPLLSEIPDDFKKYALLVDKRYKKYQWSSHKAILFLSLQYPDYLFSIQHNKKKSWSESAEYVNGVRKVQPLFTDIIFGTFFTERIPSYFNCLFFLFKSPNYRTDLIDDPYFLIWRGEIEKAKEKLDTLPPERREFIENKLRVMNRL